MMEDVNANQDHQVVQFYMNNSTRGNKDLEKPRL